MSDTCDLLCLDLPKAEELRGARPAPAVLERAAEQAKALGDPTRLEIAAALGATDELCGCDLAWVTGRSQKLVSHHVKILRGAALVTARRDGKVVFFALTPAGRTLLATVLGDPRELATT